MIQDFSPSLQPYAVQASQTRGRLFPERLFSGISPFLDDYGRILDSNAFRRLKHKTQVLDSTSGLGDHFRTRLTHTLEVSRVAGLLARRLGFNEDLAVCLSLMHDLGHPPFGHSGEKSLQTILEPYGGFEHNIQSFRIVTRLERCYPAFDGFNLSWESLEGLVKRKGPVWNLQGDLLPPYRKEKSWIIQETLQVYQQKQDLWLHTYPSGEAQIAAIADDVVYNTHDVEDGLRIGLLQVDQLDRVPLLARQMQEVRVDHPGLEEKLFVLEILRRVRSFLIEDILKETQSRLQALQPRESDSIRYALQPLVAFSEKTRKEVVGLASFLSLHFYRHPWVQEKMQQGEEIIQRLFCRYQENPSLLPEGVWKEIGNGSAQKEEGLLARAIGDFIAGMTDTYLLQMETQFRS